MPDRQFLRDHRPECSFLLGRFMVEHLIAVHRAFDGDVVAAIVLGTIAQYNVRRFYDEVVVRSGESFRALVDRGAHLPLLRPCNAMSVAQSTGVPRETVRRKVKWLLEKGWLVQAGRDKLYLSPTVASAFAEFDERMLEDFGVFLANLDRARQRLATANPPQGSTTSLPTARRV